MYSHLFIAKLHAMNMNENFLFYVWKFRLYDLPLQTTTDEELKVISPGRHNLDSGPDFSYARIVIGDTTWAGNVEIHVNASDWEKHKHQNDPAYDNIILHVVYNSDKNITRPDGSEIPVFELKGRIDTGLWEKYMNLVNSISKIPCANSIRQVPELIRDAWLDRMMVERLEVKSQRVLDRLEQNQNNWLETLYQFIARDLGSPVNSLPMELLARATPYGLLARYRDDLFRIEALLYGQSGLLPDPDGNEEYVRELKETYEFLSAKHELNKMDPVSWKFMRLRPPHFPTLRISQLSAIIHQSRHLFADIIEADSIKDVLKLLSVHASTYWDTHYRFGKPGKESIKSLGKDSIHRLIINSILPITWIYAGFIMNRDLKSKCLAWMEELHPEDNRITREWKEIGVEARSAGHSQALIHLYDEYCISKKCLNCNIGTHLLNNQKNDLQNSTFL